MGRVYNEFSVQKMGLGIDEVVTSTINFSRKNYCDYFADNPYPKDVKMVGNTIKSKKMPDYIAKFLETAIRQLLRGEGQAFIEEYYTQVEKIYNYKVPIRDIATKGKIKKTVTEYLKDIKTITKAGRPKSRQAWYELAIRDNVDVGMGETLYYINTGTSKSHNDLKKSTFYIEKDMFGGDVDRTKDIEKAWKKYGKETKEKGEEKKPKDEWVKTEFPNVTKKEVIDLKCRLVPRNIIDSDDDIYCYDLKSEEYFEYNRAKYIDMFNKRITPLLVCFSREIRSQILVTNPEDRKYFTVEECQLVSGEPNKPSDQDTYEQLMTMEDKEIRFWIKTGLIPPFLEECGMGKWEDIVADYNDRMEKERQLGIDKEKDELQKALCKLSIKDISQLIEEETVPTSISKISTYNSDTLNFMSKTYPDYSIGSVEDFIERLEYLKRCEDEMFEETGKVVCGDTDDEEESEEDNG